MAIILSPLPDCQDDVPLLDVRASLLAARAAICVARSKCRSHEAHDRLGDLVMELELAIESVHSIAEAVADEDEEREMRSREAACCNFRYARA